MTGAKGGIIMKKAVIYVRGHKQEMQEVFCRVYAAERGYKVNFVTSNIDDVNLCDVMIVSSVSRVSRDRIEYHKILNKLKEKGITVESAADHDNAADLLSVTVELLM